MGRVRGLSSFSSNFDILMAAAIDSRTVVDTKADLTDPNTFVANDGNIYLYKGLIVAVVNDTTNNGLYMLNGEDHTDPNNWKSIQSSSQSHSTAIQATLTPSNWVQEDPYYTYTYSNSSISQEYNVSIVGDLASQDIIRAADIQPAVDINNGSIKIYAYNLPTEDINITISIF